jgi:type IV pilus assembly protein PilO
MAKLNLTSAALDPFLEKIEKLSKLHKFLIVSTILVLLVGGFVYFSYMPKFRDIDNLEKKQAKLVRQLRNAKLQARAHKKFATELKATKLQFQKARQALPDKKEIPSLLAAISGSGQSAGLEFLLFRPAKEIQRDFFAEIPVEIRVLGGYHNVALFFDKVAHLSRIVNMKNTTMTAAKKSTQLETTCTAVTYRFSEVQPPKPAPKAKARAKRPKKK